MPTIRATSYLVNSQATSRFRGQVLTVIRQKQKLTIVKYETEPLIDTYIKNF